MKYLTLKIIPALLFTFLAGALFSSANGQTTGCVWNEPVFVMDFGSAGNKQTTSLQAGNQYRLTNSYCPNDGHYSIVSKTSGCFNDNWITVASDHTPNDLDGKMMLVNASYEPGVFFVTPVQGLKGNTRYELSTWMVNVCLAGNMCIPVPPQFNFIIETPEGKRLAYFVTGELKPTGSPTWVKYAAVFTTPENVGTILLKFVNKIHGGCGNDFAMDDIAIRECMVRRPPEVVTTKTGTPPSPALTKPAVKKPVKTPAPVTKPENNKKTIITTTTIKDNNTIKPSVVKIKPAPAIPSALLNRDNPVIRRIEATAGEIIIDLYDNGEIDGDTVSVYHNNQLVISRAGLSAKAVSFRLMVDKQQAHHELVMVANNLGAIPPNTSLMIVTARDKRYEVFISSSEQKNAKLVIDLKE